MNLRLPGVLLATALLAACGGQPARVGDGDTSVGTKAPRKSTVVQKRGGGYYKDDGPGDEDESRVPWRLAGCILHALGRTDEIAARFPDQPMAPILADQLANGRDWRHASSLGRLLDGVASLLGINHVTQFRGQTGILLEGKADHFGETPPLADGWRIRDGMLDLLPLLSALADEKHPERGAALFHSTLIAALTDWLCTVAPEGSTVAAGGVHRVHLGPYASRADAEKVAERIRLALGYKPTFVTR